ncbi:unnamed protein product [Mucor hiemalis]
MSNDYEPSPIKSIGDKRYLCVEYPGYVKRKDRALATLGGEKALAEALAKETAVKFSYRPGDPFVHPIQGHIIPNSKLLVKVTRRVKKDKLTGEVIKEAEGKWDTEIQGLVTKTLQFRALADFQYGVPKDDKIRQLRNALAKGDVQHMLNYKVATDDDNLEDLRNIPPPMFTPLEGPVNYGYRQSAPVLRVRVRQSDGSFQIKLLNRSRTTGTELTSIRFKEESVPSKSWHILPPLKTQAEMEVHQMLLQFFEERPVWTKVALKNKLASNLHPLIKTGLVRIAYTFIDGPWRDCWVLYGKDLRNDPECYKYQVVEYRRYIQFEEKNEKRSRRGRSNISKEPMKKQYKEQPETVEAQEKHIFDGTNATESLYQLIDVVDPEVTPIIHNPEYRKETASKMSGYYYDCAFECIRKVMKAKYNSLTDKGEPFSYPDGDKGLLEEIAKEKESGREQEEDEDTNMAEASDAVQQAMDAMGSKDKGKRLTDVVDDYMNELTKKDINGTY